MTTLAHLRRTAVAVAAAALLVCASAPSFADSNPTPHAGVSLGGRAGYFWPVGVGAGSGDWSGGAQLRWYMARFFAVEGSIDYRQQHIGAPSGTADIYPVQVSGLLYLLPGLPVSPFALGGVGWYYTNVRIANGPDQTSHRFGSHVGGGLQAFLSRHWSIDATYRYIFTDRITANSNGANVSVSGDGHMVTGGINYHF